MASQSEGSVSVELGELLELLNALEAQDSRPMENFATLERLLAAGKSAPAESPSDDQYPELQYPDDRHSEGQYPEGYGSEDHQSGAEGNIDGAISAAEELAAGDEPIAERPEWHEHERPAEIENRLAVHIIQGLRKSIIDRTS